MQLDGATILVTGANGFVGGRICQALVAAGARVRALVRRPGEASTLDAPQIEEMAGDFTDAADAATAVRQVSAVVHCAAATGPDLDGAREVNTHGTRTLTASCLDVDVDRFVHISTASVYDRTGREVIDEDTPRVTDGDPYSVTKAEAEQVVEEAMAAGLDATILRPPAVLGWGPTSTWGERFPQMLRDDEFPFTPNPRTTHVWLHVDDLADAVVAALRDDVSARRTYNVIGGHGTWARYIESIREATGSETDPFDGEPAPAWVGRFTAERIRQDLGFSASRTYDDAMAEIAAHWRGR